MLCGNCVVTIPKEKSVIRRRTEHTISKRNSTSNNLQNTTQTNKVEQYERSKTRRWTQVIWKDGQFLLLLCHSLYVMHYLPTRWSVMDEKGPGRASDKWDSSKVIRTFIIYMYVKRYTPMNCNRSTVKQSILWACGCAWKRLDCGLYRLHPQIFPTLGICQNFESYSILIYSESRLERFHWICEHASKVWNISIPNYVMVSSKATSIK
jgi:hypothetical protein